MITGIVLAIVFGAFAWAIKADREEKANPNRKKKRTTANVMMAIVFIILISAGLLGFISGGKVF